MTLKESIKILSYWNNINEDIDVVTYQKAINTAISSMEAWEKLKTDIKNIKNMPRECYGEYLRDYWDEAYESWYVSGCHHILELIDKCEEQIVKGE